MSRSPMSFVRRTLAAACCAQRQFVVLADAGRASRAGRADGARPAPRATRWQSTRRAAALVSEASPVLERRQLAAHVVDALAVLQDARALAVIGALGGFATPLIVSTGSDNYVALFAYYLVLDAGIAAVAWSKTWRLLNLIGFVATFVVATAAMPASSTR